MRPLNFPCAERFLSQATRELLAHSLAWPVKAYCIRCAPTSTNNIVAGLLLMLRQA